MAESYFLMHEVHPSRSDDTTCDGMGLGTDTVPWSMEVDISAGISFTIVLV